MSMTMYMNVIIKDLSIFFSFFLFTSLMSVVVVYYLRINDKQIIECSSMRKRLVKETIYIYIYILKETKRKIEEEGEEKSSS